MILAKSKTINRVSAIDRKYVRLDISDYLENQNFKEIIKLNKLLMYDYVLTDAFLLKARNSYAPTGQPVEEDTAKKY